METFLHLTSYSGALIILRALLNKSVLDKNFRFQPLPQAIRTLSGMPVRVILFKARIMAIASPTCAS